VLLLTKAIPLWLFGAAHDYGAAKRRIADFRGSGKSMKDIRGKSAFVSRSWVCGCTALSLLLACSVPARAAEGALGFYLLGSKTTMGGYLPGPGIYGSLSNYGYSGSANIDYENAGVIVSGDIKAKAYLPLPTMLWVINGKVAGGNLAFSVTTPIGYKTVSADALLNKPRGAPLALDYNRDNTAFGDPVFGATLGWHSGKLHYSLATLVNVPVGQWQLGNPVSIGFHRLAVDETGALTYLDPKSGLELSGAAGITFNVKNHDTDYKTGTEVHFEWAAMKHLSHTASIGLHGYAYKQIGADSGSGALLGPFKGRVFAVGPALDYTFKIGKTPVVTNLRYLHEFGVENRLKGDVGFLNFVVPISVAAAQTH